MLAVLALGSACGGGGTTGPPRGLVHLDPRLEDGSSPAEALAGAEAVVRSFEVAGTASAASDLAPWSLDNAGFLPDAPRGGVVVRALDYRPADGVIHAGMVFSEPLLASEVNAVEVDVRNFAPGNATLTWTPASIEEGLAPGLLRADAVTTAGTVETLRFTLGGHPGWRGTISELRLYPCWKGAQSYEVHAIRFVLDRFAAGHQPGVEFGEDAGDGGLIGFAGDERRVWPTDSGVPLFAEVLAYQGDRLLVDVGVAADLDDLEMATTFAVDVRTDEGSPYRELSRVTLGRGDHAAWRTLEADLPASGTAMDLRLRAWVGEGDGIGGTLERGRLWWGAPRVVPGPRAVAPPSVVLVTLDTLRTDGVGAYGGSAPTPRLDELAAKGVLFEECWAPCNSTLPSHASILTGLEVPAHGVLDNRSTLAVEVPTLAQAFRAAGYDTGAAVSVEHLQAGWSGLGRGFDRYLEYAPGASVDGAVTLDRLDRWLESWRAYGSGPVFLWVHLFDPHTPYGPPRPFLEEYAARVRSAGAEVPASVVDPATIGRTGYTREGQFLEGVTSAEYARFLYDASVAYTDTLVGRLLDGLARAGIGEEAWLAITSDHGESMGEMDVWYGHQLLHAPVMHVPMILRVPGGPQGLRVPDRISSADLARTFVDELGLSGIDPRGVALTDYLSGEEQEERRVFFVQSGQDQAGFRDGEVHYFHNLEEFLQLGPDRALPKGADFLFDPQDVGSERNLAEVAPEKAARYREAMRAWLSSVDENRRVRARLGREEEARLEELGYGGGEEGEDQ